MYLTLDKATIFDQYPGRGELLPGTHKFVATAKLHGPVAYREPEGVMSADVQ